MRNEGPGWLYLHGFASGPESKKGVALSEFFAQRGVTLQRLDLRVPSLEHLRLSEMMKVVRAAIGGPQDRAVVFGSSMGALCAARVAEEDARVCSLVLLAPAFRMVEQQRRRYGADVFERWRRDDGLPILDYTTNRQTTVDYGFVTDVETIDARNGGFPDVRVPTLLIHGTRDDTCDIALSRQWAKGKRHVRMVEVDDGHELTSSVEVIAKEAERFLAPFLSAPRRSGS